MLSGVDVRVGLLGPLRLIVNGTDVEVRGPMRRAVLALLALAEGRSVTVGHLLDALYPTDIPDSGRHALHTHVSRLRAHLGPAAERLTTLQDGYRLDLDELDLTRARMLLAGARTGDAVALLREAHALWRGPVLVDLLDVAPIAAAVEGFARLHRDVTDALVDARSPPGRPPPCSTSRPPPTRQTRCASPRFCCSCARSPRLDGHQKRCASAASTAAGW